MPNVLSGTYACCVSERDGQVHTILCVETGAEFIWSPAEQGTYEAAQNEHYDVHAAVHQRARDTQWALDYHNSWCRLVCCPQCDYLIASRDAARAAAQGVSF